MTRDPNWLGPAISPGEVLREEFLEALGISQIDAARRLGVSLNRLNEIILGKRGISADTAIRLARLFKTSAQFWMRLQADWDLQQAVERASMAEVDLPRGLRSVRGVMQRGSRADDRRNLGSKP